MTSKGECNEKLPAAGDCACCRDEDEPSGSRSRRTVLKSALLAAVAWQGSLWSGKAKAETSGAAGSPDAAEAEPQGLAPQVGDRLTFYSKRRRGPFITLADLEMGGKQVMVLPVDKETGVIRDGSRNNRILLQRFDPAELEPGTIEFSAEGAVAYSAVCTHNGCPVTAWDRKNQTYMCPCHQSQFDPRNAASVVEGPAPRKLPTLPLEVEQGEIVVADGFASPVGFGRRVG